ncbi:cytochrome c-type protein NapC [compost metagenome]
MHSTYLVDRTKTCIDCHKGIAHTLPNMPPGPVSDAAPASGAPKEVAHAPR